MVPPLSVASAAKSAGVNSDESIASASIAEVLKFVEVLGAIHQDGTLEYPFIHIVNMEYPERNRGFDIVLVNDIEHQGYTRDGFHIRKAVAVMDSTRREAFVPYNKNSYPGSPCAHVRGPVAGLLAPEHHIVS
jgi:hypothetical protein